MRCCEHRRGQCRRPWNSHSRMGCAASTPSAAGITLPSHDGTMRVAKVNESGLLDLSELDLEQLPAAVLALAPAIVELALEKNAHGLTLVCDVCPQGMSNGRREMQYLSVRLVLAVLAVGTHLPN